MKIDNSLRCRLHLHLDSVSEEVYRAREGRGEEIRWRWEGKIWADLENPMKRSTGPEHEMGP